MKRAMFFLVAAGIIAAVSAAPWSRERPKQRPRFYRPVVEEFVSDIPGFEPRASLAAAVDTYCIASYDFEQMNWQGWTRVDNTDQKGVFFHVDDFAGLNGGTYGRLYPLEGTKSLWCGARPGSDFYLCSWHNAPGYGNGWNQGCCSSVIPHTGVLTWSYKCAVDTEPYYDYVSVIHSPAYQDTEIARYYGTETLVETHQLFSAAASTKLAFLFFSDEWCSDQDGLRDFDGAFIVDSITVSDENGVIDFEDFESYAVGETHDMGIWYADAECAYGTYSGLAAGLEDKDPCNRNSSSVMMFFNGSMYPSGEYPGLYDTPFCIGTGGIERPCQNELVVSPPIDLTRYSTNRDEVQDADIPPGELGDMGGVLLSYSAYIDLPVTNLVFHTWKVRNIEGGCPGLWLDNSQIRYYLENGLWYRYEHDISDFVTSDSIQVALGVVDMCSAWYGIYGDCAEHTPAPWYDNVMVSRFDTRGPRWRYQAAELFQDNFPSTDDIESCVRADMAADISPPDHPGIVPGDSIVVSCWAPNAGGLDTLGTGEPRVYFHCNAHFLGPDGKPDLYGPQLEGDYGRYVSDDGDWTILLCEPAWTSVGIIAPDKYCVDLNDSLFTRGYMVEYYFKAFDLDGVSSTLPDNAETIPLFQYAACMSSNLFEFTCLPTLWAVPYLLYVDDFDGRGTHQGTVQTYFDPTFDAVIATGEPMPDRYDVNQPSSMVGNGLGSRARLSHLSAHYKQILWDSGDLAEGTIISGASTDDKSDDIGLLIAWMDTIWSGYGFGLMVMGDNIASDVSQFADGQVLLNDWCGVSLVDPSYYELTGGCSGGGITTPLVSGIEDGLFDGHEFYIFSGCPALADLDVLDAVGNGIPALLYPEFGGDQYYAGVISKPVNSLGIDVYTEWYGFSFMRIRNAVNGTLARNRFLVRAWRSWLHGPGPNLDITGDEVPAVTVLSGVYPNPFNPATRVAFSLKKKGHVSMRVYDVSGRLVRVLLNEVREAGSYEVVWDGMNDAGRRTASGIYFCRMEAGDYERTLKMVQLK